MNSQKRRLFQDTVIRLELVDGVVAAYWLMDKPSKGWESYGFRYLTLEALLRDWDITVGERRRDVHGEYLIAADNPTEEE